MQIEEAKHFFSAKTLAMFYIIVERTCATGSCLSHSIEIEKFGVGTKVKLLMWHLKPNKQASGCEQLEQMR